jgi:hypothetical protein
MTPARYGRNDGVYDDERHSGSFENASLNDTEGEMTSHFGSIWRRGFTHLSKNIEVDAI